MKNIKFLLTITLCILTSSLSQVNAAFTIRNGSIVNADYVAEFPADVHFENGRNAMEACDWDEAARQFCVLTTCFPNSPFGQEAFFYLGVAEYNRCEYDFADKALSQYLKCQNNPQNFIPAIEYKFLIAEQLRCGAKRRLCGTKQLPKWATGKTMALRIYNEVIAAMPSSELAAQALYSRGCLLWAVGEHRDSIESYQLLCKRFPKSELTPQCYVLISQVYFNMCENEPQNPDILAFAELNARKFKLEFPKEECVLEAERNVQLIKELYAGGLYDTGRFYERTCHPTASVIYYYSAIRQFPDTEVAMMCRNRLAYLDPEYCEERL
jgi:outer membrane protein assembly factor BamD (BamD/ComL family)